MHKLSGPLWENSARAKAARHGFVQGFAGRSRAADHQSLEGRAGSIQSPQNEARTSSLQTLKVLPDRQPGPEVGNRFRLLLGKSTFPCKANLQVCWCICLQCRMHEAHILPCFTLCSSIYPPSKPSPPRPPGLCFNLDISNSLCHRGS